MIPPHLIFHLIFFLFTLSTAGRSFIFLHLSFLLFFLLSFLLHFPLNTKHPTLSTMRPSSITNAFVFGLLGLAPIAAGLSVPGSTTDVERRYVVSELDSGYETPQANQMK